MGSNERFSWLNSDKKTDGKKSSSDSSYVNAPIGAAGAAEHVDISRQHENEVELHPRVLPRPLFEELIAVKKDGETEDKEKEALDNAVRVLPHVELDTEVDRRPTFEEYQPRLPEEVTEAAEDEGEEDDEDEDDDDDKPKKTATTPPAAPLDTGELHSAVDTLIERLEDDAAQDEAVEASAAEAADSETPEPETYGPKPFVYHESEPVTSSETADDDAPDTMPAPIIPPPPPPIGPGPRMEFDDGEFVPPPPEASPYYPAFAEPAPFEARASILAPNPAFAAEQINQRAIKDAEYRGERRGVLIGVVAGAVTGWVLKQFFANRRLHRFEQAAAKQLNERDRQFAAVQSEQSRMEERMNEQKRQLEQYQYNNQRLEQAPVPFGVPQTAERPPAVPERPAPAVSVPEAVPVAARQLSTEELQRRATEQQIVLQPGQRLERRGWYSVVLDENGHEVPGAIVYGEGIIGEQKHEQAPVAHTVQDSAGLQGGGAYAVGQPSYNPNPMLPSGQADPAHSLQSAYPVPVDINHRLKPQSALVATLANPVLWLAAALIIIAFFIAALL